MPPTPIRRPLTITTWTLMALACLVLSPLLLLIAWVAAAVTRRPQPVLFTRLVIAYFVRELGVMLTCAVLWLASGFGWRIRSPRFRQLHYRLLHWFVHGLAQRVLTLLTIHVDDDGSGAAFGALKADRPLLFFSRHAGPGDTLLLVDLLLSRYRRLPSVVFKETLAVDPSVDLMGHRLPHAILDTSNTEDCEAQIERVAAELADRGVLVLFPEGGNFTHERREKALRRLRRKGRWRELRTGQDMTHMLPPHPTGFLSALRGNPEADVIFAAHTGLGLAAFPRELWRHTPIGQTLQTRVWLAPATERPRDPEEQIQWLNSWWRRLDEWVDAQGEETAADAAPDTSASASG
jgi:1-acyl-sn-glycerol-3-phosphate acyltransferase